MVSTTTAANASSPGSGCTLATRPNCTTPPSSTTTYTSSIDQWPTVSTMRYSRARSARRHAGLRCTVHASSASAPILISGTAMLAMKTMTARIHELSFHSSPMPPAMV